MSLRNLLVQLSIEVGGQSKLAAADNSMNKLLKSAEGVGRALKGIGLGLSAGVLVAGLAGFIESNIKSADALYNQAAKLGMTTDELQKYDYAAAQFGITQTETAVAIRFFNRAIGEAQLGTKSAVKTFSQLGLLKEAQDPLTSTSDLLMKFSDRLQKIPSQGQRTAFVMRTLGRGGSAMLPILQQGSKKIREVFSDIDELGGGFDQKFAESSHLLEIALKKLRMGWRTISVAITREFIPAMNWVLEKGTAVAKFLIYLSKHTYVFRTALIFLTATFGVLAAAFVLALAIMYAPLAPILVSLAIFLDIMTALYVAFDDFYTFLEGGESVLGNFLEKLGGKGEAKKFRDQLVTAFDDVKKAFGFMTDSSDSFHKSLLMNFVESLPGIIKWGGMFAVNVVHQLDRAVTFLRELSVAWDLFFGNIRLKEGQKMLLEMEDAFVARTKALKDLNNKLNDIGKPRDWDRNPTVPGDAEFSGPLPQGFVQGAANLPAPPPPPLNVQVTNNVHPGVDGGPPTVSTKVKINGDTQNRNTHQAVRQGMPSVEVFTP